VYCGCTSWSVMSSSNGFSFPTLQGPFFPQHLAVLVHFSTTSSDARRSYFFTSTGEHTIQAPPPISAKSTAAPSAHSSASDNPHPHHKYTIVPPTGHGGRPPRAPLNAVAYRQSSRQNPAHREGARARGGKEAYREGERAQGRGWRPAREHTHEAGGGAPGGRPRETALSVSV